MRRIELEPRLNWRESINRSGLIYSTSQKPGVGPVEYWNDSAAYVFTLPEVEELERQSEELHRMCLEAARYMATGELGMLGLTDDGFELARRSLDAGDPDVYARFDLAYAGDGSPAKMLEYNGDTPTGLIEAAITQWDWFQDRIGMGDLTPAWDQWNGIYDALIERWGVLLQRSFQQGTGGRLFYGYSADDPSGEDWSTVAVMAEMAQKAGWRTTSIEMAQIGWNFDRHEFVGMPENPMHSTDLFGAGAARDGSVQPTIRNIFKLYPWEDIMSGENGDHFGRLLLDYPGVIPNWFEPPWKMFLSNKLLLVALWRLYPGHPNLLPAYLGSPEGMRDYVIKPVFGREGDGIKIVRDGVQTANGEEYRRAGRGGERVFQQYHELPNFPGLAGANHPVLGSWIVNQESFGVGIRESDGPITDYYCRFAPNLIEP
ncbi:MAG: glutathionylspermidine synthase family protein [Arthrobacter sp.]|jgi:glutathionylspermidine synthase|nr:glutathionylspermidine synthase family protein [Arthrobacter sp.]